MATSHQTIATGSLAVGGMAKARIVRNLVMSPKADEFLADLSEETGLSEGQVIRLALGIFKIAVDAKQQGKHVGVAETSEALEIELSGF